MKYTVIVLCVIAFATGFHRRGRIYGGQDATPGQFPFMVALDDYILFCNGVIIAPNWILTAAKCLFNFSPGATLYVGSNLNDVNGTGYRITNIIVHEDYDYTSYQNDIGLIKLSTDLVFSDTVQAIQFSGSVPANATCTVLGWGATQDEILSATLQYVEVTTIDMELCQNISADHANDLYLGPEQICSLAPQGKGTCFGDEGGPLVCDGKLAGIFSYNVDYSCGQGMPEVYSSVSAYLNWILAVIQP